MIKNIEFHLAGVERTSNEFGVDAEYLAEKKAREEQVFYGDKFEKFKESQYFEGMTDHQKQ